MSDTPSLHQALGYRTGSRNAMHRAVLRVTGTAASSKLMAKIVAPLDAVVKRLSKGRHTASSLLAGLPLITITTVGARSGEPRQNLLLAIPDGGDLAVIASNFGQQKSPGWVYNLRANPDATVTYRDVAIAVVARLANAEESERVFNNGAAINPTFRVYRQRVTEREIPVFILSLLG